jgi:hypothetical protein
VRDLRLAARWGDLPERVATRDGLGFFSLFAIVHYFLVAIEPLINAKRDHGKKK